MVCEIPLRSWVTKKISQALEPLLVSLIAIQTPAVEWGFRVRVRWWTRHFRSIQVLECQPKQIRALRHSSRMFERPHPSIQTHSSYRVFTRIMNCSILYFVAANKDKFFHELSVWIEFCFSESRQRPVKEREHISHPHVQEHVQDTNKIPTPCFWICAFTRHVPRFNNCSAAFNKSNLSNMQIYEKWRLTLSRFLSETEACGSHHLSSPTVGK